MPRSVWHSEDGKSTFVLDDKGFIDIIPGPNSSVFAYITANFDKKVNPYKNVNSHIHWALPE